MEQPSANLRYFEENFPIYMDFLFSSNINDGSLPVKPFWDGQQVFVEKKC